MYVTFKQRVENELCRGRAKSIICTSSIFYYFDKALNVNISSHIITINGCVQTKPHYEKCATHLLD